MNRSAVSGGYSTVTVKHEPLRATALLFDLDGTLVDSAPDICNAVNQVLNDLRRPRITLEETRNWIGNGLRRFLQKALVPDGEGSLDPLLLERAYSMFESHYAKSVWTNSVVYPGVLDGLAQLEAVGFKMGCVTNKPRFCTCLLLDQAGLARYFDVVVAGVDLTETKPAPAPLLHAAKHLGAMPDECVMIGDSRNDVEAARAAGMAILALTSGYHQGVDLNEIGATRLASEFSQILELIHHI